MARFNSMYEEYVKYPAITRQRMFYEAMEDVLPDMKVIIEGGDGSSGAAAAAAGAVWRLRTALVQARRRRQENGE